MTISKKNIFLNNTVEPLPYASESKPIGHDYPTRNPASHANFIRNKLQECYSRALTDKQVAAIRYKDGVYLEFSSASNCDLAIKSLENRKQGIRLLNVKNDDETQTIKATVYIPAGKESYFISKIEAYGAELTDKDKPKNNDLVSSIEDVKIAMLDSFWVGNKDAIPDGTPLWCEVWIRYDFDAIDEAEQSFIQCSNELEIIINNNHIVFPERIVRLVKANAEQLKNLISICSYIAEIRRAPDPTSFFDELSGAEQQVWVEELLERTNFSESNASVCLLDTGVSATHPLLSPAIIIDNIQAVNPSWGSDDHYGHGTEMAGIALYKDLKEKLIQTESHNVVHKIESVKILPPRGVNPFELYGAITEQAVALAEISNPTAERAICMAVTSSEFNSDDGSPTSWSASIDSITSGADGSDEKRLFFVSAGNVHPDELTRLNYPDVNILHSVENPGQAWNAITVGAFAKDIHISDPVYHGCTPVADVGELSPYSSTSVSWSSKWPIKPEIVFDGGNIATNGADFSSCEDLSLLTTNFKPLIKPFSTIWGTSSATAQAAWMAAQILTEYPGIWPETVRALIIHSAKWTDKMRSQFCKEDTKTKGRRILLRSCGYGIPDLQRAIQCMDNSVNLVIQGELQPYDKNKMNEMHLHKIPWPKEVLLSLADTEVEMRVTLSYFIEPGPGEVGWKDKYRYPSCGLRYDVINSNETKEDFQKRVNIKMRGEDKKDKGDGSSGSSRWYLGADNRDVGSIHSDFCIDSGVNLCETNYIAVYPIIGWWRERSYLGRYNSKVRYSLVVSISTPKVDVDLYTPIVTQISNSVTVEVQIPY